MRPSYLHRITLRQIEIYLAVSRLRSYSRAAEELALTQPAVSAQMRQLEQLTGEMLFEYRSKQLHITRAGQALERAARDMQQRLVGVEMELAELRGEIKGTLSIAIESSAQYFMPELLAGFSQQFPQVQINLEVGNRASAVKRLLDNRHELVITCSPPEDRSIQFTPFRENQLIIVAWPDHPLRDHKSIPFAALAKETFLIREPGSGTRLILDELFGQAAVQPKATHLLGSSEALIAGVINRLGVALLPIDSCATELAEKKLITLNIANHPIRRSWCILHRRNQPLTPVCEQFKLLITR